MPDIDLTAGRIHYEDTGGDGPPVVLLHGLLMDHTLWRDVLPLLEDSHRCILPTLPLGAHRRPMRADADLTIRGQAKLVAELLERLELDGVTLVFNDWGAAQVLIADGLDQRIGRLVLASCEAFDNYPPGLPGKAIGLAAKLPGGIYAALQPLRLRPLRRLPLTFGWMSRRGVPDEMMDAWLEPILSDRAIRRDLHRYASAIASRAQLLDWAEAQRSFERPVLIAWAAEDRVMPVAHARRLAELYPNARLVEIPDSYTLIPIDQPAVLAGAIRAFISETTVAATGSAAAESA